MRRSRGGGLLVDTNLLIYAFRPESPEHPAAHAWLTGLVNRGERLLLTSATLVSFARLTTSPRIVRRPVAVDQVLAFIDSLRSGPGTQQAEPGPGYAEIFARVCTAGRLQGNDIPDAHLAAVAIEHGAVLATHDRGFDRFDDLRTIDPLA